jgi:hypothetical protein
LADDQEDVVEDDPLAEEEPTEEGETNEEDSPVVVEVVDLEEENQEKPNTGAF